MENKFVKKMVEIFDEIIIRRRKVTV